MADAPAPINYSPKVSYHIQSPSAPTPSSDTYGQAQAAPQGAGGQPLPSGSYLAGPQQTATASMAPPAPLTADPAYNAFMNRLGLSQADMANQAVLNQALNYAGAQRGINQLNQAEPLAEQRVAGALNARGVLNSSFAQGPGGTLPQLASSYAAKVAGLQANKQAATERTMQALGVKLAGGDANAMQKGQQAAGNVASQGAGVGM